MLQDYCVEIPYAHSSDFDRIEGKDISFSNFALLLKKVIYLSAQLGVFIKVGEVRLGEINFGGVGIFFLLFVFDFFCL